MYFTHGLFLTCTQKISFVFTRHAFRYLHDVQAIFLKPSCNNKVTRFTYLEGQLLSRGDEFPSILVPILVTTAPPLAFTPLTPFSPTVHITLQSWCSSLGTVTVRRRWTITNFALQFNYMFTIPLQKKTISQSFRGASWTRLCQWWFQLRCSTENTVACSNAEQGNDDIYSSGCL